MFPAFSFDTGELAHVTSQGGYIPWSDLTNIYVNDKKLAVNLRNPNF